MRSVGDFDLETICSGCGLCSYICPCDAILLKLNKNGEYKPVIDEQNCIDCGQCIKVCPGIDRNWDALEKEVFGKISKDIYIGNYKNIRYGFAKDKDIRYTASSGGLVSGLLIYMLDKGFMDGAVVTRFVYGNRIKAESFIAKTKEEILDSCGSKYCPVDNQQALKELKKFKGKVAIVCLPCTAMSLRKAIAVDKTLQDKVGYIFSLFCGRTPSYKALDSFFKANNIKPSQVKKIAIRGEGWPGKTSVCRIDGVKKNFPYLDIWGKFFGKDMFLPVSCYCCYDFFGEFADVSFGDAWIPQCKEDTMGSSVLITRTKEIDNIIMQAMDDNIFELLPLDSRDLKKSFFSNLLVKKVNNIIHERLVKASFPVGQDKKVKRINMWGYIYETIRLMEIKCAKSDIMMKVLSSKLVYRILRKIKNFLIRQQMKVVKL